MCLQNEDKLHRTIVKEVYKDKDRNVLYDKDDYEIAAHIDEEYNIGDTVEFFMLSDELGITEKQYNSDN